MEQQRLGLMALSLVLILGLFSGCSSSSSPTPEMQFNQSTFARNGVTFIYPIDWDDYTDEVVKEMSDVGFDEGVSIVALLGEPQGLAILEVTDLAPDNPDGLAELDDERQAALNASAGFLDSALSSYKILEDREELFVANKRAFQTKFTGKLLDIDYKGYLLVVVHNQSLSLFTYLAEEEYWDDLGGVYHKIKQSITFN